MKTICTATEYENWFYLRNHKDAQPEIQVLAEAMQYAMDHSTPMKIYHNEWHVPYVNRSRSYDNKLQYFTEDESFLTQDEAKMISASCCAQVSYRKNDDTLDKAKAIFDRLVYNDPPHASPIEHQATPTYDYKWYPVNDTNTWSPGITHVNKFGEFCSGNFVGWIQYRQLFSNQAK